MADETDFLDLYGKLGLRPGCTLPEFRQAYRRSVARWHPDRRTGSAADALAARRLQRLTAQYGAAMEFHRRHGRLPGAPLVARAQPAESALSTRVREPIASRAVSGAASASPASPAHVPRVSLRRRWGAVAAIAVAAGISWVLWPQAAPIEGTRGTVAAATLDVQTPAATPMLQPGMMPEEVLAVEGEPTLRGPDRWEYGPSWVRFEGGHLAEWHSSPLHTLHVTTAP